MNTMPILYSLIIHEMAPIDFPMRFYHDFVIRRDDESRLNKPLSGREYPGPLQNLKRLA